MEENLDTFEPHTSNLAGHRARFDRFYLYEHMEEANFQFTDWWPDAERRIRHVLSRQLGRRNMDLDDVVQQTAFVVWRKMESRALEFHELPAFISYCTRVARHQAIDQIRMESTRRRLLPNLFATFRAKESQFVPVDTRLLAQELWEAIDSLTDSQERAVFLDHVAGLSIRNIAKRHDLSKSAADRIKRRAIHRIERSLETDP